ncbi:MAG: hypothetical protein HY421_01550 [Candidatus Kerfeldbacteria bacterium]|nr:hypothetical protein [Candidatus Kerfeldbacteria bacterium]
MSSSFDSALERAIIAALAYHDVFEYPLRVEEVWRWLYVSDGRAWEAVQRATPADVEQALQRLQVARAVDRAGEWVTLRGRSGIIATRLERHAANLRKWQRAEGVTRLLRIVPFVQFVGVVNTLALDNARPESDIDLFVVAGRGRLWLTRLLVTVVVHLLGLRRHDLHVADRVCLSFFVSEAALGLQPLRLAGVDDDVYLTYWTSQVVPLYERGDAWAAFQQANRWIVDRLPHGLVGTPSPRFGSGMLTPILRAAPELLLTTPLGAVSEWLAKRLQLLVMRDKYWSRRSAGTTEVVVNNEVLKFHERDRRAAYRAAWQQRLQARGLG